MWPRRISQKRNGECSREEAAAARSTDKLRRDRKERDCHGNTRSTTKRARLTLGVNRLLKLTQGANIHFKLIKQLGGCLMETIQHLIKWKTSLLLHLVENK